MRAPASCAVFAGGMKGSRRGGAALLTSHQSLSLREPVPRTLDLDQFAVGA